VALIGSSKLLQICPLDPIIGACRADNNILERIRVEVPSGAWPLQFARRSFTVTDARLNTNISGTVTFMSLEDPSEIDSWLTIVLP
jgi:hypothetical protein